MSLVNQHTKAENVKVVKKRFLRLSFRRSFKIWYWGLPNRRCCLVISMISNQKHSLSVGQGSHTPIHDASESDDKGPSVSRAPISQCCQISWGKQATIPTMQCYTAGVWCCFSERWCRHYPRFNFAPEWHHWKQFIRLLPLESQKALCSFFHPKTCKHTLMCKIQLI